MTLHTFFKQRPWIIPAYVVTLLIAGSTYWFIKIKPPASNSTISDKPSEKPVLFWYDPMVPDQHFDKPGKSPFMDMQLVPKYADEQSSASVTINNTVQQNLGLRTEKVNLQILSSEIRAAGYIAMDEHRIYSVPVRTGGYVEKLLAKAVGDDVQAGQKVAEVFAPELLIAQREYITLLESAPNATTDKLRVSAVHKLQRLGMAEQEITQIAERKVPFDRVGVYAPSDGFVSGHVLNIDLREGAKVESGQSLMLVADLNRVWQIIEVPEREAGRIHVGQQAEIHLASSPDTTIKGEVDYIYPELDGTTRTLRVRVSLANPKHQLRPGQYAETVIHGTSHQALLIASSAVIRTGVRSVAIVQENNHFHPVQVTTGDEQNGKTEILSGLKAGETVVASGQFLIDSEASLNGVLARMESPAAGEKP